MRTTHLFRVSIVSAFTLALLAFGSAAEAAPDGIFVYPQKGQGEAKKAEDDRGCASWANKETGFDPSRGPAPVYTGQPREGEAARGAVRGAARGAIIGAIAGDAGKGAAIGAGAGMLGGAARRRGAEDASRQAQAQSDADFRRGMDRYKRAYGACMTARGYSVN